MATFDGARFLGAERDVGSIAPGKAADLLVVRGNPAEKIEDVRHVALVFKNAVGYDPAALRASTRGLIAWQ